VHLQELQCAVDLIDEAGLLREDVRRGDAAGRTRQGPTLVGR
jgi:hypothetical protein